MEVIRHYFNFAYVDDDCSGHRRALAKHKLAWQSCVIVPVATKKPGCIRSVL